MKAQLCPKCLGQGVVSRPPWIPADVPYWTSTQTSFTCDVCSGTKVIYVPENGEPVPYGRLEMGAL